MVSAHLLSPLQAHFVRSLEGDEQDFFPPMPADFKEVTGDNSDFSRGLALAFPSIWVRMNTHQRLEAIYITACIEKGIEIPAEVLRVKPVASPKLLQQKEVPRPEATRTGICKTSRGEILRLVMFGSTADVAGVLRQAETTVREFVSTHEQRLAAKLNRLAEVKQAS